jgi:S-adenosyl methyltransferase
MRHNQSMSQDGDWRTTFRPDIPSGARVYDHLLGGKDNYPADREVARKLMAQLPNIRIAVQWNREFLRRAVRYLVSDAKITQIIDIGAGLPTVGNTHEIAQETARGTRVVYVDHDPVVLSHARDMLQGLPDVTIIEQEFSRPDKILADPELLGLIDFSQPVAVMLLSILHFIPDSDDPAGCISRLLGAFPPGSYVAISHATGDAIPAVNDVERAFDNATEHGRVRTRAEVLQLVDGLDMVPPGMVWLPEWRPDPGAAVPENVAESYYCAVVARTP